ncbi:MAG: PAS domain S-box protein, partial [Bacteroidota bacterium]|nr:PAS domain S-box protein [Bacteroidota bacterium]
DIEKLKEAIDKSLKDSELYECQYRFQKIQSGKVIWSRGIVTFQDGKPVKMKGSMMDVSQNYLLNQQLKESEKTFRQLIQNAPDAVIVIDNSSKILLWNPKAEAIFGWKMDEIIGENFVETIIPIQDIESHTNGNFSLKLTGQQNLLNKTIEITAINKEGKEFFIALSIASSLWNGKQVFISFIRNITKEKKIEKELERHRKQLCQKNKELEKMNSELTSFSYVASHDLKEPLRKIKTYSNLIIEKHNESLSSDGKEYIQRIINSAGNMQRLIDDLLAFSQTTSGVKKLETLDLNVLLEEVENSLKDTIEENNVTITSTQLPTLRVIDFQFRQLLENLIGNAIKYRKIDVKPNITITSSLVSGKSYINEGADANKNYQKFLFADNGMGFEQEYATKIVEIFQRLHGKSEYSGTGIGLAICKKIMENHNGFITAQSQVGEGSVFNVFFPVKIAVNELDY